MLLLCCASQVLDFGFRKLWSAYDGLLLGMYDKIVALLREKALCYLLLPARAKGAPSN